MTRLYCRNCDNPSGGDMFCSDQCDAAYDVARASAEKASAERAKMVARIAELELAVLRREDEIDALRDRC